MNLRLALSFALSFVASAAVAASQAHTPDPFASGHQAKDHPGERYRIPNYEAFRHASMPTSVWVDHEKASAAELVGRAQVPTLVVPVQIDGGGFDVATRSAMTLALWRAVYGEASGADPHAIERAFGDGAREVQSSDVVRTANLIGASRLLFVYAGHDDGKVMRVTAQAWHREGAAPWAAEPQLVVTAPLDEKRLPAQVFISDVMPRIAAMIHAPTPSGALPFSVPAVIPAGIADTLDLSRRYPASRAVVYQLLGMLAPDAPARARERMFEQSLVLLPSGDSSALRVIRARAVYYLHSRPAALAALDGLTTPEAAALRAIANGNLPDAAEATSKITNEWMRLFAEIELRTLQRAYDAPVDGGATNWMATFLKKHPEWGPLVVLRLEKRGALGLEANVQLKLLLEKVQPADGPGILKSIEADRALGKNVDVAALARSPFEHVRTARASGKLREQCAGWESSCTRNAFLDLMEASAIADVVESIDYASDFQAAHDTALSLAREWNPVLEGQPDFEMEVAKALLAAAPPDLSQSQPRTVEARRHAMTAFYFEHGQSRTALEARGRGGYSIPALDELYAHDLPVRAFYAGASFDAEWAQESMRMRLAQSSDDIQWFRLASSAPSTKPERAAQLLAEMSQRFAGHPERLKVLAALKGKAPQQPAARDEDERARLEHALSERPDLWDGYYAMAEYFEHQGLYEEAAEVLHRFPGFAKGGQGYNAVGLSNWAWQAGSLFWFRGEFAEARTFFKIAADLRTGSAASIGSEARLLTLDRNFARAAQAVGVRATRYDDPYAYRDLLSWMFVFGQGGDAWTGFEQLATQRNPQVWQAAHVGLRMGQRDDKTTRAWLFSEPMRTAQAGGKFALAEAVMLGAVDRKPPEDLAQTLRELEGDGAAKYQERDHFVLARDGTLLLGGSDIQAPLKDGETVSSDLVYFADAYVPLRAGRHAQAAERFAAMARTYPVGTTKAPHEDNYSYALPYYAWASVRSGDKQGLEAQLEKRIAEGKKGFDQLLALAVFAGMHGHHDRAVELLSRSFDTRPYTERRPVFTEYQWAETCEWLFEATHEPRYRDLALKMARINQVIQPYSAWAWAVEAKLSEAKDRQRALGYALYLDAGSERLASVPQGEKDAARKWFEANNPFMNAAADRGRGQAS